jgi:uncharacterized membrane protein
MVKRRLRVPISLPISIVIFLVLGLVSGPFIRTRATPEQLATNVLLSAIPFILIFIAIILAFITLIVLMANLLNNNISPRVYRPVEMALIAGIVLGIIGMFQPWLFAAYRYGFIVLLISTLGYILWSHISPKGTAPVEESGSLPIEEG